MNQLILGFIAVAMSATASASTPTQSIECSVYPANGGHVKVALGASFARSRGASSSVTLPFGDYSATLDSHGGDGGEPGSVTFVISYKGKMLHKTLWQAGDSLSQAGQKTGLNYVVENINMPGSAELQYVCRSK